MNLKLQNIFAVSNFLKKCGLSAFVASSYPSQRRTACQMDENIIAFEKNERERLAAKMTTKAITICEDETVHPQICLVGTESVFNYILVEKYTEDRKTETWFFECLDRTFDNVDDVVAHVMKKAQLWKKWEAVSLNDRQKKILNKLIDGFEGELTSSKWAKIAKCSQDTALRDIVDLVNQGVLAKDKGGGRSTSYSLIDE